MALLRFPRGIEDYLLERWRHSDTLPDSEISDRWGSEGKMVALNIYLAYFIRYRSQIEVSGDVLVDETFGYVDVEFALELW